MQNKYVAKLLVHPVYISNSEVHRTPKPDSDCDSDGVGVAKAKVFGVGIKMIESLSMTPTPKKFPCMKGFFSGINVEVILVQQLYSLALI
jgi:hypothetical protein